jgi:peptidoglycan/xylan/chitin deacetylase (PgdA/CDA1 family)
MGNTLILMYHRITELDTDPWALAVTPASFEDHLDVITSRSEVVPLRDTLDRATRSARPCVTFTFDDGYADNLPPARMLAARGLPATYFLAAGQLGSPRQFWWDEVATIFLDSANLPDTLELELESGRLQLDLLNDAEADGDRVDGRPWRADQEPRTARQRVYLQSYRALRPLDPEQRERGLEALAEWADIAREARPGMRSLTLDEVAELCALDGVEIGAHTITHPVLASLPAERQRKEIVGSRRLLEEASGRPVESFAYPHGTRADYTPETVSIVAEAGLRRACAAVGGPLRPPVQPYELPRFMVEDWDGAEFERRFAEAFGAQG